MFRVEPEQFRGPLQDAIRWCAELPLASDGRDSPAVSNRRALLEQANLLWEQAIQLTKSNWRKRTVRDTDQWKAAQLLWAEILDSSRPILSGFRSSKLRPSLPIDEYKTESDWSNAVDDVVVKRSRILKQEWTSQHSTLAKGGRLLLYFPLENLADGAAQVNSAGFYDVDNVPPWDIWIGFSRGALISWVPPTLIEIAQMGIDANPENCIQWADQ